MEEVSYLTIGEETREIVDAKSRSDIIKLQEQIEYLAEQLNIDLSNIEEN